VPLLTDEAGDASAAVATPKVGRSVGPLADDSVFALGYVSYVVLVLSLNMEESSTKLCRHHLLTRCLLHVQHSQSAIRHLVESK